MRRFGRQPPLGQLDVRAPLWALLALLAACYASHVGGSRDGGSPGLDSAVRADGALPDAGADAGRCEDLPGAPECGCVGGYRRCDTCDTRCPEGEFCWRTLGVCRPADGFTAEGTPINETCSLPYSGDLRGATHCPGGGPCAMAREAAREQNGLGPCVSDAFCRAAPEAEPPLPDLVCVGSSGLPWRSPPPAETCPDPRFCGGPCGRCPDGEDGPQSCIGVDERRPFGVCSSLSRYSCEDRRAPRRGTACLKLEPRAVDELGWRVDAETCRAYAERYEGVRCLRL